MEKDILEKSICFTCMELSNCFSAKTASQAKIYCEEFKDYTDTQKSSFYLSEEAPVNGRIKDLHMNCNNRATCVYKDASPIKWYCEEYS